MNKYFAKEGIVGLFDGEDIKILDDFYVSIRDVVIATEDGEYNGKEVKAGDVFILLYNDDNTVILSKEDPFAKYVHKKHDEWLERRNQSVDSEEACCDCDKCAA